jgi:hypothetical protein
MRTEKKLARAPKLMATGVGLAVLAIGGGTTAGRGVVDSPLRANHEKQTAATQGSKFYCNSKALQPAERAHHKQLTDKVMSARKEAIETEKGYEFQFSPSDVSLSELADWVAAEGKCCPFFDFHIDLEREGTLLCLRLTGAEGIKAFIRSEFQVAAR